MFTYSLYNLWLSIESDLFLLVSLSLVHDIRFLQKLLVSGIIWIMECHVTQQVTSVSKHLHSKNKRENQKKFFFELHIHGKIVEIPSIALCLKVKGEFYFTS